jgi:hypothetical protein
MRANPALVQSVNKGVGLLDSSFLCPDQAVEGTEDHVMSLSKALGLNRDAELVLGTLVLSARRAWNGWTGLTKFCWKCRVYPSSLSECLLVTVYMLPHR